MFNGMNESLQLNNKTFLVEVTISRWDSPFTVVESNIQMQGQKIIGALWIDPFSLSE